MSDDLFLAVLYRRIRKARQATPLTQMDMADRMQITLRQYQRLESSASKRRTDPPISQLREVAKILNVDLCALVYEPTQMELEEVQQRPHKAGRPRKETQKAP